MRGRSLNQKRRLRPLRPVDLQEPEDIDDQGSCPTARSTTSEAAGARRWPIRGIPARPRLPHGLPDADALPRRRSARPSERGPPRASAGRETRTPRRLLSKYPRGSRPRSTRCSAQAAQSRRRPPRLVYSSPSLRPTAARNHTSSLWLPRPVPPRRTGPSSFLSSGVAQTFANCANRRDRRTAWPSTRNRQGLLAAGACVRDDCSAHQDDRRKPVANLRTSRKGGLGRRAFAPTDARGLPPGERSSCGAARRSGCRTPDDDHNSIRGVRPLRLPARTS